MEASNPLPFRQTMKNLQATMLTAIESAEKLCSLTEEVETAKGDIKKCTTCVFCASDLFKNPTCCGLPVIKEDVKGVPYPES